MKVSLHDMLSMRDIEDLNDDSKEMIEAEVIAKTDSYILMFDFKERDIERKKAIVKSINASIKSEEKELDRAKKRLLDVMQQFKVQNLKGDLGTINLRTVNESLGIDYTKYKTDEEILKALGNKYEGILYEVVNKPIIKFNKDLILDLVKKKEIDLECFYVKESSKTIAIPKIDKSIE